MLIEEEIILTYKCSMRACSGIPVVDMMPHSLYGWQHSFIDRISREWFSSGTSLSKQYGDGWLFQPEINFVVNYIAVNGANIAKLILQECSRMRKRNMIAIRVKSYNQSSDNAPMIEMVFVESERSKVTMSDFCLNQLVN